MKDLHAAIMNLPNESHCYPGKSADWHAGFAEGHRDARHAAAELVQAASAVRDSEVQRLRDALTQAERRMFFAWQMLEAINENDPSRDRKKAVDRAADGLSEIREALKEQPK